MSPFEAELEMRARQQRAIAALGQRALGGLTDSALLDVAVGLVAETLAVPCASVLESLPGGERLVLRAGIGYPDGVVGRECVPAGAASLAGYTILTGEPVVVADLRRERRFDVPPLLARLGLVSGVTVVIAGVGGPFGVLGALTDQLRVFVQDDIEFLTAVANVLGAAIQRQAVEAELRASEARYRQLVEELPVVAYTNEPRAESAANASLYMSPRIQSLLGYSAADWERDPELFVKLVHPDDRERILTEVARARREHGAFRGEYRLIHRDGQSVWLHDEASYVDKGGQTLVRGYLADVSERKRAEALAAGQQLLLERIASGRPLAEILELLARTIEGQSEGLLASVLLVDADGAHLRHGAAPSLPASYTDAVDGVAIGPDVGSCGSAAYHRELVIVEDISIDPRWAPFRELALGHDLRACWSAPVLGADGELFGAFALYYREPRGPSECELELIRAAAHLARIAIERARAGERLAEAELRYRTLVEHLPLVTYVLSLSDPAAPCVYVSPQVEPLLGYGPGEWTADPRFWSNRLLHPDDRERVVAEFERSRQLGEPFESEYRLCASDGRSVWMLDRSVVIRDASGQPALLQGYLLDVTASVEAQEQLRRSQELYRLVVENTNDAIVVFEPDGRLRFASPSVEALLGYEPAELVGVSFPSLVHPADLAAANGHIQAALSGGRPAAQPARLRHKDGRWVLLAGVASPIFDQSGRLEAVIATGRDITELSQLEEELRQAQKLEAVGRLAGGVAHDFNNMMAAVLGFADLLLQPLPDEHAMRPNLELICEAARRAQDLTRQLLAFSRRQVLQPRLLDLNELVTDVQRLLATLIGEDIELVDELEAELWPVAVDPTQLTQVLVNLAVNAREAMPTGGRLTITTGNVEVDRPQPPRSALEAGCYVVLSVGDTGRGMDADTRARIFEPFFTTKDEGTGLGLATVFGIVKQSGGEITVESEPGAGATFRVFLPRAHERAAQPSPQQAERRPLAGQGTVLVVEDEELVRRLAREVLERCGYRVLAAATPAEALDVIDEDVDLLLTDVVMPGMSGPELARKLLQLRPALRVLYMSGYTHDTVNRYTLHRAARLLAKPFSPSQLAACVRSALEEGQKADARADDGTGAARPRVLPPFGGRGVPASGR